MKYLVTGASGYVGRNLVKALVERGLEVRALVRRTSDIQPLLKAGEVEIFYGDITDLSSLKEAVKNCGVVFHSAALVNDWGPYQKFYQVNYLGTKNVLKASLQARVKKFIQISTLGVTDLKRQQIIKEDQPYSNFSSAYCRTKAEAEKLVMSHRHKIPIVIIRPGVVYGPGDPQCTTRTLRYASKHLLFLVNQGKGIFPTIYIDDLTQALLLAAQSEKAINHIFNIVDGENITTSQFFNYCNEIAGRGKIKLSLPYALAWMSALFMDIFAKMTSIPPLMSWTALEFLTLDCTFDISKARRLLGFHPQISLEQGMKRVKIWWEALNHQKKGNSHLE